MLPRSLWASAIICWRFHCKDKGSSQAIARGIAPYGYCVIIMTALFFARGGWGRAGNISSPVDTHLLKIGTGKDRHRNGYVLQGFFNLARTFSIAAERLSTTCATAGVAAATTNTGRANENPFIYSTLLIYRGDLFLSRVRTGADSVDPGLFHPMRRTADLYSLRE
jgi:hypothetical protein